MRYQNGYWIIDPIEWDYLNGVPVFTDETDQFRIICDIENDQFKLLGESLTYCGDSVYYFGIYDGMPRAYHANYGYTLDYMNEDQEFCEPVAIELKFMERMQWLREYDEEMESCAYGFIEYLDEEQFTPKYTRDNDRMIFYATHYLDTTDGNANYDLVCELLEYYYRVK